MLKKKANERCALISIVDDQDSFREGMEHLLKSHGFLTATYASAREFLNSDRLVDTCCLISDVEMPEMDGAELFRQLKVSGYRFPVLFVTGSSDDGIARQLLAAGAQAVLSKPCSSHVLIDTLTLALQSCHSNLR